MTLLDALPGWLHSWGQRQAERWPAVPTQPGNIDLHHRPVVHNRDGSISTVRSITVTDDQGRGILLPTVSDDERVMSNRGALDLYRRTGRNLGTFQNEDDANRYAVQLHNQQAREYLPRQRRVLPRGAGLD